MVKLVFIVVRPKQFCVGEGTQVELSRTITKSTPTVTLLLNVQSTHVSWMLSPSRSLERIQQADYHTERERTYVEFGASVELGGYSGMRETSGEVPNV